MIIRNAIQRPRNEKSYSLAEVVDLLNPRTGSGQVVTVDRTNNVATAYRCINVLSDDVAKLPFQVFTNREAGKIEKISANSRMQNIAWLMERSPNRKQTPFIFKKTIMRWLICWGDAYVWKPLPRPGQRTELYILPTDETAPVYDVAGNLWFKTRFDNQEIAYLPSSEVFHLMINSKDGIRGNAVITYAREAIGRQLAGYETQDSFFSQGLNPGGLMWVDGSVNKEAREKIRESYQEAMGGSGNAGRLAVIDSKVSKFETITMKPVDVQFLQMLEDNDVQIANFFGVPLYKINHGKEAYNSNEQQNLDYLNTTLDPYLVQWEQEALLKWLPESDQDYTYFKFNRDALLRTDAKTRSEIISSRIQSGVLTPNEGRQIEDLSAFTGGDRHYFPSNMAVIGEDGALETAGNVTQLNIGK